jgi:hypothetical protein
MLTRSMHVDRATTLGGGHGIFVLDCMAVWCKILGQMANHDSLRAATQKEFFRAASPLRLTAYRGLVRPIRNELGPEMRSTLQAVGTTLSQVGHPKSEAFRLVQTLRWEDPRANYRLVRDLLMGFDALPQQYRDESLLNKAVR